MLYDTIRHYTITYCTILYRCARVTPEVPFLLRIMQPGVEDGFWRLRKISAVKVRTCLYVFVCWLYVCQLSYWLASQTLAPPSLASRAVVVIVIVTVIRSNSNRNMIVIIILVMVVIILASPSRAPWRACGRRRNPSSWAGPPPRVHIMPIQMVLVIYIYIYIYIHLLISLSLYIHIYIYTYVYVSIHPSIHPSIYL